MSYQVRANFSKKLISSGYQAIYVERAMKIYEANYIGMPYSLELVVKIMDTLAKSDEQYLIAQQQQQEIMMQLQQNPQMYSSMSSNVPNVNKFNRAINNDIIGLSPPLPSSPSDARLNSSMSNNIIQMNMMANSILGSESLPAPSYSSDECSENDMNHKNGGSVSASALMFDAMNKRKKLKKVKRNYEFKQPFTEEEHPPIAANLFNNQQIWKPRSNSYQLQNQTINQPMAIQPESNEERMNREIQQQLAAMAKAENNLHIIDAYLPATQIQRNQSDYNIHHGGNIINDVSNAQDLRHSVSMRKRSKRKSKKAVRKSSSSVINRSSNQRTVNELMNKFNAREENHSKSIGNVANYRAVVPVGGNNSLPILMQSHSQSIRQMPNIANAYEMKSNKIDIGGGNSTPVVIDGGNITFDITQSSQTNVTLDVTPTATATATEKFFYTWNTFSILKWLNTIENGKFNSYKYLNIKQAIKHSNMNGKEMLDMNDLTLRMLKVDEENDRQLILQNIQQLEGNTSIGISDVNINECLDAYLCPLSYKVMSDPVIVSVDGYTYGNTYEREIIVDYIQRFQAEPFTKEKINLQMLVSNTVLKNVIERWNTNQ